MRGVCPPPAAGVPQMCGQTGSAPPSAGKGLGKAGCPHLASRVPTSLLSRGTRGPRDSPRRAPGTPQPSPKPAPAQPHAARSAPVRVHRCPRPRRVPAPVQPLLPTVFIRGRRAEAEASSLAPAAVAAFCVVAATTVSRQLTPGKENARELGRPRPSLSRSHESQLRPVR